MNEKPEPVKQQQMETQEIDLLELAGFYLSKIVYVILSFVAGALILGLYTYFCITPKYTASAKVYMVSTTNESVVDLTALNLGTALSSDYEVLMTIRPIFNEVIDELKLDYTYDEMKKMVSISALNDTRIIELSVTSTDPQEAMDMANMLAEKAVSYLPELMETPAPNIAERAILPTEKSSPSLTKNVAKGALIFTVLCLGILTVIFLLDDTMKTAEDVEKEFGIMPLAVIPEGDVPALKDKSKNGKKEAGGKRKR